MKKNINNKNFLNIQPVKLLSKKSPHPNPPRPGREQTAFTLAEVLITLGIIGVVAAMTLPTVIKNYQKQSTVNRLKVAYNTLYQAIKLSEADNGNAEGWDFSMSGDDFFDTYIKKYIKFVKIYPSTEYASKAKIRYLHGGICNGEGWCKTDTEKPGKSIVLPNGSVFILEDNSTSTCNCRLVSIDINGLKSPNIIGKDIFTFIIQADKHTLVPMGQNKIHNPTDGGKLYIRDDVLSTKFNQSCNKIQKGGYCSGIIMYDGWQIKDDYPW